MRTAPDREKRTRNQSIISNTAESVNVNGLKELKVMDNESFGKEEAAFLDVKRAKIGKRRQIHFL